MTYKAVLSDLDGTLVKVGSNTVSPKVKEAIVKAKKRNIPLIFVTGRSTRTLVELAEQCGAKGLVIFDNGAGIYDTRDEKILWQSTFSAEIANEILTATQRYKPLAIGLETSEGKITNPLELPQHIAVRKLYFASFSPEKCKEIIDELQSKFPTFSIVEASSLKGKDFYDIYITNGDATKQHAVVKLSEILGIPTEDMIGIGDHYNDFSLLMACGLKVAMGNAVDELKAIADYIAPSLDDDGVADVIEKYILKEPRSFY